MNKSARLWLGAVALTACLPLAVAPVQAASFQGLGDLSGGRYYSVATDVSADGSTVVGSSYIGEEADGDPVSEAFTWTIDDGMIGLGHFPDGNPGSYAYCVSADGSVVVGRARDAGQWAHIGFRWTAAEGMVSIHRERSDWSTPSDVSADGSVIVGQYPIAAFRWTEETGMTPLPAVPGEWDGGSWTNANGVSQDGSVVVGSGMIGSHDYAFRWTETDGFVALRDIGPPSDPPIDYTWGQAISSDGSTIAGVAWWDDASGPFWWTEETGMVRMLLPPELAGGWNIYNGPEAVSGDGSLVVGRWPNTAFIWDAQHEVRNLQDVFISEYGLGPPMEGWLLERASGISDDGRVIVGSGINPSGYREAWVAVIPEPSTAVLAAMGCLTLLVFAGRRCRLTRNT